MFIKYCFLGILIMILEMIPACVEANTLSQKYYLSFCTSCHQEKFLKSQLLTIKNWQDIKNLEQLPKNHIMKHLRMGYTDEQWQMIIDALQ